MIIGSDDYYDVEFYLEDTDAGKCLKASSLDFFTKSVEMEALSQVSQAVENVVDAISSNR